jgi:CTP synthase (UTP-ammonia lyase)
MPRIAVVADYQPDLPSHIATAAALKHAASDLGVDFSIEWQATEPLAGDTVRLLSQFDGFFIGPGSPYKSMQGALNAIRFARESGRPLLGTCGGFQHVVIEYARNILRIADAQHAEYNANASNLLIIALTCSLAGKTLRINLIPNSLACGIYGRQQIEERYHCAFGLSPNHRRALEDAGLITTGVESGEELTRGEARIVEISQHPFFIATLFVPQMLSTAASPHPLITAFLRAVVARERVFSGR